VTTLGNPDRLAILVHEVRSPVAALSAIAGAYGAADLERPARQELVALVVAACRAIERLVSDVAIASVRLEEVDLGRLIFDVAAAAAVGGARVRAEMATGLPRLRADPLRLRQALDNLVSNALVHAPGGDAVVVRAVAEGGGVVLSVTDAGPGVTAADQETIFDPGTRLDARRPGAGLGLAVARAIAEAHGGTLAVTSTPGQGATFTIALPAS
jgi:signal transduction histidine kinase